MAFDLDSVFPAPIRPPIGWCPATGRVETLRKDGYLRGSPAEWDAGLIPVEFPDWTTFARSWDRLDPDCWMGDGGGYRRRRFAAFHLEEGSISRKRHQPHYQSRQHNRLNGGFMRWFSPVERAIGNHPVTINLLQIGEALADALAGWTEPAWHAEMHQFRIAADAMEAGHPTPEGLHRDGVSAVLIMLVGRHNVAGGVTTITEDGRFVTEVTLSQPRDGVFLDDSRLQHCVSPITAADSDRPGWRDALVLTFRPDRTFSSPALKEIHHG